MGNPTTAREYFEGHLREQIQYNLEHNILPSENEIARRLLIRGDELIEVYDELHAKLFQDDTSRKVFINCILSAAAFWSPDRIAQDRADRVELSTLNRTIATRAYELADLLNRRDDLHNHSGFSSETHYDIVAVIHQACAKNGRYESYLKDPLAQLSARFDMKYWPRLFDVIQVIATDAEQAEVIASDPLTESATQSKRPSAADFTRALRAAIDENKGTWFGAIPNDFALSDQGMATLINVLLDLPVEKMIDPVHVKNSRNKHKKLKAK